MPYATCEGCGSRNIHFALCPNCNRDYKQMRKAMLLLANWASRHAENCKGESPNSLIAEAMELAEQIDVTTEHNNI